MIASLEGIIAEASPTNIVLEVGGVGYEVHVPVTTAERLPGLNQKTKLHIRAIYREDTQALYGFATREDKDLFNVIIDKVSGVGPKIALGILSQHNADTLKAAIATEDVKLLSKCPGIGKKSAERIIVELKDFMGASLLLHPQQKLLEALRLQNLARRPRVCRMQLLHSQLLATSLPKQKKQCLRQCRCSAKMRM